MLLVAYATIPAWIATYFFMNKWLQNFHYHVTLRYWEFIVSFVVTLVIALLTVSYRTYRAAIANPAEVLKYE
jgi:ABC-type lipoprotein release transport system permease subunit